MRAAPLPARARLAAVQTADRSPSAQVLSRRGTVRGMSEVDWQTRYQDWQPWARRFARENGAAAFSSAVISDCCARCIIRVEERDPDSGEWEPSEDPAFDGLFDLYRNELQGPDELVRLHAHHYQVAGEMLQTQRDGNGGVEYGIYSTAVAEWDKPDRGVVTVKLVPDGKVERETAFVVPRRQVVRFWMPDAEWQAYAWSPMAASIDDLHRYRALARYARRTAESSLVMNGVLWAPEGPFQEPPVDPTGEDLGSIRPGLEDQYFQAASLRFSETADVAAVAPMLLHWEREDGPPEWIKMGDGLDEAGIAHRREALEDFARGTNLPVTTLVGGGVGDANHWSEWLASDKFFDSGVAPTMDRICHLDLTRSFLWPRARLAGWDQERLDNLRVGYDPTPVIVKPDQSEKAIKLRMSGVINEDSTLEACGFTEDDKLVDQAEREWLLEVLARGGSVTSPQPGEGGEPSPVGPGNVVEMPPPRPLEPPEPSGDGQVPVAAAAGTSGRAEHLLARLVKLRQQVGSRLLAEAEYAYDAALRQAGVKLMTRARGRSSPTRAAQVAAAVEERAPLRPLLAAVGMRDHELLQHAFDTFRGRAARHLEQYARRVAAVFAQAGATAPTFDTGSAVELLVSGLTAMVRTRLLQGDEAALAAAAPSLVPRALRRPSVGFEDLLPGMPDPSELAAASARLVRQSLGVVEGRLAVTVPPSADLMPEVVVTMDPYTVEERLAADLQVEPVWTWVHGFYGEPLNPFDPHVDLDGYETTDRETNPDLANTEAWPEVDVFAPDDHPGCTCEWVPTR